MAMIYCYLELIGLCLIGIISDPVLCTLQNILDGVCDGQIYGDSPPTGSLSRDHFGFIRGIYSGCKHVLRNVEIDRDVTTTGGSFRFDFLSGLTRIDGRIRINNAQSSKRLQLRSLVSIGGEGDDGRNSYSLDIKTENSVPINTMGLTSLTTVEEGSISIDSQDCYVNNLNTAKLFTNLSTQRANVSPNPCQRCLPNWADDLNVTGSCSSNCDGNCWGPAADECQLITDDCSSSCTNGCFGRGGTQCCSTECSGGCRGSGVGNCFRYAECTHFSDVNGTCIPKCEFVNMDSTDCIPTYSRGYVLYRKYCLKTCPEELPQFDVEDTGSSASLSVAISANGQMRSIAIFNRGTDYWLAVEYNRLVLFYYAIMYSNRPSEGSAGNSYVTEYTDFYTNSVDIFEKTSGPPNANMARWDLCSFSYRYIPAQYLVRCTQGERARLINSLGIKAKESATLSQLTRIDTFGFGEKNEALNQETYRNQGRDLRSKIVDGMVSSQFYTSTITVNWCRIKIGRIIRLSHAVIYTKPTGGNINGQLVSISRYANAEFTPSANVATNGWPRCCRLSTAESHRYVVKSCDLLPKPENHPYLKQFAISWGSIAYLVEVEIYKYEEKSLGFFIHNHTCVPECLNGYQPDGWRNCTRCDGVCDKYCDFGNTVYSENNYMSIEKDCTHVKGHVVLAFTSVPPRANDELYERLGTIKEISGSLIIRSGPGTATFTSLSMFRNLRLILGDGDWRSSALCPDYSVSICSRSYALVVQLPSLLSLNLDEVVDIKGDMYMSTPNLCLPSQSNVNLSLNTLFDGEDVIEQYACSSAPRCHSECAVDCVGTTNSECLPCPPGAPTECRMCKNYQMGRACVPDCGSLDVYKGTNQCGPCHDQCVGGCSGPLNTDCNQCKNFQMREKCAEKCPDYLIPSNRSTHCLTCEDKGFNETIQEENLYKFHILYGGEGILTWFAEILPDCHLKCQRKAQTYMIEVGFQNGSQWINSTISSETRTLDLRQIVKEDTQHDTLNLRLLSPSVVGEGHVQVHSSMRVHLTGVLHYIPESTTIKATTETTTDPTTTTLPMTTTTSEPFTSTSLHASTTTTTASTTSSAFSTSTVSSSSIPNTTTTIELVTSTHSQSTINSTVISQSTLISTSDPALKVIRIVNCSIEETNKSRLEKKRVQIPPEGNLPFSVLVVFILVVCIGLFISGCTCLSKENTEMQIERSYWKDAINSKDSEQNFPRSTFEDEKNETNKHTGALIVANNASQLEPGQERISELPAGDHASVPSVFIDINHEKSYEQRLTSTPPKHHKIQNLVEEFSSISEEPKYRSLRRFSGNLSTPMFVHQSGLTSNQTSKVIVDGVPSGAQEPLDNHYTLSPWMNEVSKDKTASRTHTSKKTKKENKKIPKKVGSKASKTAEPKTKNTVKGKASGIKSSKKTQSSKQIVKVQSSKLLGEKIGEKILAGTKRSELAGMNRLELAGTNRSELAGANRSELASTNRLNDESIPLIIGEIPTADSVGEIDIKGTTLDVSLLNSSSSSTNLLSSKKVNKIERK